MSNHRTWTWDQRGSKPLDLKFLLLDHHLNGYANSTLILEMNAEQIVFYKILFFFYKKNIILIYFNTRNILKNNRNHTLNQYCVITPTPIVREVINSCLKVLFPWNTYLQIKSSFLNLSAFPSVSNCLKNERNKNY